MPEPNPRNKNQPPNHEETQSSPKHESDTIDPRDLVQKGNYRKHPREIVENPAVTPQMLDEPQESRAGFIREDRDEAEQ